MIPRIEWAFLTRIAQSPAGSGARLDFVEQPDSVATRDFGGPKDLAASKADVRKAVGRKMVSHRAPHRAVIALSAASKTAV